MKEVLDQEKVVAKKSGFKKGTDKDKLQFLLIILVAVLLAAVIALSWYIFDVLNNKLNKLGQADSAEVRKSLELDMSMEDPKASEVLEKVSKHILLPARDFQIYTVNDASILWKENPLLYQYVMNGNKLIAYDTGVIVYDQELDKIIDVIQFYGEREKGLQTINTDTIKQ